MLPKNNNLNNAKKAKNDEFYTQLCDIEKELKHYTHHFKNKIVYCNCDNAEWSNFFKYFKDNFHSLGLKQLISSHYDNEKTSYSYSYNGIEITKTPLLGNGDFRSEECIEILKEADIVITNPPFSLFRKYIKQLMDYDKQFLVIGATNALTYKYIFQLILNKKINLGLNNIKIFKQQDGLFKSFGNIVWWTNLSYLKKIPYLDLSKTYNELSYPKYDNYDAINVDKTKDIPMDYQGLMGVPISYFLKHNPNQFEIIDSIKPKINKKELYQRFIIKNKNLGEVQNVA